MTKRVKAVRVGRKHLRVEHVEMDDAFGHTDYVPRGKKSGRIRLEKSLRPGSVPYISTLLHEMIHQMDWRLSEERTVALEYGLVNMVLSNPDVFKALAKQAPRRPK